MEGLRLARLPDDAIRAIPGWELERPAPERQWMVQGALPQSTVCMLSGDGGIGKSLVAQQLCTAAVMGRPWLGMPTQRGAALMFSCEDDHLELHRRHHSILEHMGLEHADLDHALHLVDRVGCENGLAERIRYSTRMQPTALAKRLLQYCLQHGIRYVVIDTATQCFGDGNQNDEISVVSFVNILRRIAIAIAGVVLLTKHPSVTGRANGSGESGSTAWSNSVRSRLYFREEANEGGTVLSGMKSNYSRKLEKLKLRWSKGVFVVDEPEPVDRWYDDR